MTKKITIIKIFRAIQPLFFFDIIFLNKFFVDLRSNDILYSIKREKNKTCDVLKIRV